MVPLVSLFSYLSSPAAYVNDSSPGRNAESSNDLVQVTTGGDEDADKWRRQIETALKFFDRMQDWSIAAKKSKDAVVGAATEADPYVGNGLAGNFTFTSDTAAQFGQAVWGPSPNGEAAMNSFWDDMMWESGFNDMPGWVPGLEQFDWGPPTIHQGDPNVGGHDWSQWGPS